MPRRRSTSAKKKTPAPWWLAVVAVLALVLFGAGQLAHYLASDSGRVLVFRSLHVGERARVVRIVGRRVRQGLAAAHVPPGQVREDIVAGGEGGTPHWHVTLGRDGSPMLVNYEVTRAVERLGAEVLSGREVPGADGEVTLTMAIGLRGQPLQELVVERPGRTRDRAKRLVPEPPAPVRVAVVLLGLSENPQLAPALLARHEPFAIAAPAPASGKDELARAAHAAGHELVLMVPMEPENYPKVNPGPGTLLVNMSAGHIRGRLRDDLHAAGTVVAVANQMGSFATQDEAFMGACYDELKEQRLPFLHLSAAPRAVCKPLAARLGVAYDEPTATLDTEARAQTPAALERAWREVLALATRRGRAIVVVRVTPLSAKWLPEALAAPTLGPVTLVPLSAVIHHPETR